MDPISPQPSSEPVPSPSPTISPKVLGIGAIVILLLIAGGAYAYMHPTQDTPTPPAPDAGSSTALPEGAILPSSAVHWVPSSDLHTSVHLGPDCVGGYWIDSGHVASCSPFQALDVPADLATFEVMQPNDSTALLGLSFAKDKSNVYINANALAGADPDSARPFYILSNVTKKKTDFRLMYVADAAHVWWSDGSPVASADAATFTPIYTTRTYNGDTYYSFLFYKDSAHVWSDVSYNEPPTFVPDADPATFGFIGIIPSGGVLEPSYVFSKDKDHVYINDEKSDRVISGADPATFKLLTNRAGGESGYTLDKNHVYWIDTVIEGADPATFTLTSGSDGFGAAEDKNHEYRGSTVVE